MKKSLWPLSFTESDIRGPKEIIEEQAALLPSLTGDLISGRVRDIAPSTTTILNTISIKKSYDFNFSFAFESKFIKNYSFLIIKVSHPVLFYPCLVELNESIAKEIGYNNTHIEVDSMQKFEDLLERVLKSEKVAQVVGSLMKLAK